MNFDFDVQRSLGASVETGLVVLKHDDFVRSRRAHTLMPRLRKIVDAMGAASAKVQWY
jgi:hypothetical protein